MKFKYLGVFAAGMIIGATVLFTAERIPLIFALLRSPAALQAGLAGTWQGSVTVNGTDVDFTLMVKDQGNSLAGVIAAPQVGNVNCDHFKIDAAGNIAFSAHVDDKHADFVGKVTPKFDFMSGEMTGDAGMGAWTLTKYK